MENHVILTPQTKEQLVNEITYNVISAIELLFDKVDKADSNTEYLTGKEVESFLKISHQTRYDWGRRGILKPYKIRSRTRYKKIEVLNALSVLETKNF